MEKGYNHVGRPTNEEVAARKRKKILMIGVPIFVLAILISIMFSNGGIASIMGNGALNYYCEDSDFQLNGNQCIKEEEESIIVTGDVNLDGNVNSGDLQPLYDYVYSYKDLTSNQIIAADLDEDDKVTNFDYDILKGAISKSSSISSAQNTSSKLNISNDSLEYINKRKCPKSTQENVAYTLKEDKCIKKTVKNALLRSGAFYIVYDGNDGKVKKGMSMETQKVDVSKSNNKLQKNKFVRYSKNAYLTNYNGEPYVFDGWIAYKSSGGPSSSNQFDKVFCNIDETGATGRWFSMDEYQKGLVLTGGRCIHGKHLFKDEEEIKNIAAPNETIKMVAQWSNFFKLSEITNVFSGKNINTNRLAVKYNVGGFDAIYLSGSRYLEDYVKNDKDKTIQDLHVELFGSTEHFFLSQDLFENKPHQIFITRLSSDNSSVFLQHIGNCGHGMFDINYKKKTTDAMYTFLSCDKDNELNKNNPTDFGSKIYKYRKNSLLSKVLTPSNNIDNNSFELFYDGINIKSGNTKFNRENVKIDEKNGTALFRSAKGNIQYFSLYKFDSDSNVIEGKIKDFVIPATPKTFQGYDIDGQILYLYYGESGANTSDRSAYIDTYALNKETKINGTENSIQLLKHNTVYEYKQNDVFDVFMEAEGISIAGDNAYIAMAITSKEAPKSGQENEIGNSATLNYKYALVYKTSKRYLR